jgi:hypothetical protein
MKKRSRRSVRSAARSRASRSTRGAVDFTRILAHDDSHNDTHGDYHQDQHGDQHQDHDDSPGHDDFGDSILDRFERFVSRMERAFTGLRLELLQAVDERAAAQAARIAALEQRIASLERRR